MAIVAAGLVVRLTIAAATAGTNDVDTWLAFIDAARSHGAWNLYDIHEWPTVPVFNFNHGPLTALGVQIAAWVGDVVPLGERLLVRVPAILADAGSTLLVYGLVARTRGSKAGLAAAALIGLNPVLILVSGFHGNTDSVFIVLTLAAIFLIGRGRSTLAGVSYAAAMAVKIVPILVAPAILFSMPAGAQRRRFAFVTAVTSALMWLPALAVDFAGVVREVFLYRGFVGAWGLSSLFADTTGVATSVPGRELWTMLLLSAVAVSGYLMGRRGPERIEAAVAASFLVFLVLAPGFGMQYLAWPVAFLVVAGAIMGSVYSAAAGVFLYVTYAWWSGGGWSLDFADAWSTSPLWNSTGETLKFALWVITLALAVALHMRRTGASGEAPAALAHASSA